VIAMAEAAASTSNAADEDFLVFEENWQAVSVFTALATQWKLIAGAADALYVGLDYVSLEAVFRLEQVPATEWRSVFQDLRVMERAALPVLNERS
jgi:hypothetical protein